MIEQFVTLGRYFLERDGKSDDAASYAQDPTLKFKSKNVYLLVFGEKGFKQIKVEEYSANRKGWYLYRAGPANGCDATPTTGFPKWKANDNDDFRSSVGKRIDRIARSIRQVLTRCVHEANSLEQNELEKMALHLSADKEAILEAIKKADLPAPATLTIGWQAKDSDLKRVGDYAIFREAVCRAGIEAARGKKSQGSPSGVGQCLICGTPSVNVCGFLQIHNFKFYVLDKAGSVSGGFDPANAWRNFPACDKCCRSADYASDKVKEKLSFPFYGFKYLVLPLPVLARETEAFSMLDGLIAARMTSKAARKLTNAEEEIFYVIGEEKNLLQVDLVFYKPDPNYFRPLLYVSGLLPTHFRKLFEAKEKIDENPFFREGQKFSEGEFTFGSLRNVLKADGGASNFDDDFFEAVKCALELRPYPAARLVGVGMRWVRQAFAQNSRVDERALADLTRVLMFFELLEKNLATKKGEPMNLVVYGDSPQSDRVRAFFESAPGKLRVDAASQAAFLMGACCKRIMDIQERERGARPFEGKLKGLRLTELDIKRLLPEALEKATAYGEENRRKVSGLFECVGAALLAAGEGWSLAPDEVSYYFALGLVLAPRLAAASANNSTATSDAVNRLTNAQGEQHA